METRSRLTQGGLLLLGIVIGALALLSWMTLMNGADELGSGPRQNRDHWRSAYGLYSCTEGEQGGWLAHFDSYDDPLGIHSHDDGAISIHPFVPESAGENAVVGHFFDAMRADLSDNRIVLPDGTVLDESTDCPEGDAPVLHIRTWPGVWAVGVEAPTVITEDLASARFRSEGEVWMFVHAPLDAALPPLPSERYLAARWLHATGPVETQDGTTLAGSQLAGDRSEMGHLIGSALPQQNRLAVTDMIEIGDTTWVASSYPPFTRTALIEERYPERGFDPSGGEVVTLRGRRVGQSFSTNGFPLTFITADDSYVYAGRQGDGGYPHSALVRIDQQRFGVDRIVFPERALADTRPADDAAFWAERGWTLGSEEQRHLFDIGDYAAIFAP